MQTGDSSRTNYLLFFKSNDGRKKCIDGSHQCDGCHTSGDFMKTKGRYVNHSKKANLKPIHKLLDGKEHVLFIASRDIHPDQELLFDYGLRRARTGKL